MLPSALPRENPKGRFPACAMVIPFLETSRNMPLAAEISISLGQPNPPPLPAAPQWDRRPPRLVTPMRSPDTAQRSFFSARRFAPWPILALILLLYVVTIVILHPAAIFGSILDVGQPADTSWTPSGLKPHGGPAQAC